MRILSIASFVIAFPLIEGNTFERDVIHARRPQTAPSEAELYQKLLAKARPYYRKLEDGDDAVGDDAAGDDAAGDDLAGDDAANDDAEKNQGYDYDNFQFDVTNYSMKYVKCQMIKSWSDQMAQSGANTVLVSEKYVVFRFCPTQYCFSGSTLGCDSDYGEYILKLEDYLGAMSDYNKERKEKYCDYCAQCYRRNRNLEDAADDAAADDAVGDDVAADDAVDDAAAEGGQYGCEDSYGCYNYENACAQEEVDLSNYFGCYQFQTRYGDVYYLGPRCESDGITISLAVYYDQYCSRIVENADVYDMSGVQLPDEGLSKYYSKDCISCRESELQWELVDEDAEDDDQVSGICEALYYDSGKCNRYYKYYSKNSYGSNQQSDEETTVCTYIGNVLTGYDEDGEIYLDSGTFDFVNGFQTYSFASEEVTVGQIIVISISFFLMITLAAYSCYLHRAIMRKAPWRPNRSGPAAIAGQISRQNSGIIMGRSRSGGSHYSGGQMA